jgi:hypothetical protein
MSRRTANQPGFVFDSGHGPWQLFEEFSLDSSPFIAMLLASLRGGNGLPARLDILGRVARKGEEIQERGTLAKLRAFAVSGQQKTGQQKRCRLRSRRTTVPYPIG